MKELLVVLLFFGAKSFAQTTESSSVLCPKNGLKNPTFTKCNAYYICQNRQPVEVECYPSTYYYNCETQTCQNITHCCAPAPSPTSAPPPTSSPPLKDPSTTENLCPHDGAKLPNPVDCNSYYVCKNNKPVLENCPNEQHYSCWDFTCITTTIGECIDNQTSEGHSCSNEGTKLQNPISCNSYYQCINGKTKLFNCPVNTEYNDWFEKCVKNDESHCTLSISVTSSTTTTTTIAPSSNYDACPVEDATLPNPTNCKTYFRCVNHRIIEDKCPDGTGYSCWDQKCEASPNCLNNKDQEGTNCNNNGYRLPAGTCNSYYECDDGVVVKKRCPPNLEFNDRFQKCVKSSESHCTTPKTTTTTTTTTKKPSTTKPTSTTAQTLPPSIRCRNDQEGQTIQNPNDCNSYYVCRNTYVTLQYCPSENSYDVLIGKCNPTLDVICFNTQTIRDNQYCSPREDGFTVGDIKNCKNYYLCIRSKLKKRACKSKYHYSIWSKSCVYVGKDKCDNDPKIFGFSNI